MTYYILLRTDSIEIHVFESYYFRWKSSNWYLLILFDMKIIGLFFSYIVTCIKKKAFLIQKKVPYTTNI